MYESYEKLMERKLEQVSQKRDRRQGSIIFDAMAPNAAETALFYTDLEMLENRTYGDTATEEDLTRRCMERGVFRKEATKATFLGRFLDHKKQGFDVPIGMRFNLEELNYIVVENTQTKGEYILECETAGEEGNQYLGSLIPITYLEGLAEGELIELLTEGEDEEDDDSLRKRYYNSFNTDAFGGNIEDYKIKVMALKGVGGVKVTPVWNGGGTVKLTIIDGNYNTPIEGEIEKIQQMIDPEKRGLGYGIAPIGHQVTVEGAREIKFNIEMNLTLKEDVNEHKVIEDIKTFIEEYFSNLKKQWADMQYLTVRISYLESRALDAEGVIDVQDTKINGNTQNYILEYNEIPILESVVTK